jgi:hypothetical protein
MQQLLTSSWQLLEAGRAEASQAAAAVKTTPAAAEDPLEAWRRRRRQQQAQQQHTQALHCSPQVNSRRKVPEIIMNVAMKRTPSGF